MCLGILLINLGLQIQYRPYNDDKLNSLETMSLSSSIIVFFNGIYFQANQNAIIDWMMIILMVCSVAYFILNWSIDYFRVVGVSIGGRMGNTLVKILGNPENLRKSRNNKSISRTKDLRNINPNNALINKKTKFDNKFKIKHNKHNLEVLDMIDLGDKNKSKTDNRLKLQNNIEMGSLGHNIDNFDALYMISNQTKKDKKFGSSILY